MSQDVPDIVALPIIRLLALLSESFILENKSLQHLIFLNSSSFKFKTTPDNRQSGVINAMIRLHVVLVFLLRPIRVTFSSGKH